MNIHYLPVIVIVPLVIVSYYLGYISVIVPVAFLVVSAFTYFLYYKDKSAAGRGVWRTPETTLHMMSLMCGWPGAIIAQQTLRHKTRKKRFQLVFWLTVLVNVTGLLWLHT